MVPELVEREKPRNSNPKNPRKLKKDKEKQEKVIEKINKLLIMFLLNYSKYIYFYMEYIYTNR